MQPRGLHDWRLRNLADRGVYDTVTRAGPDHGCAEFIDRADQYPRHNYRHKHYQLWQSQPNGDQPIGQRGNGRVSGADVLHKSA